MKTQRIAIGLTVVNLGLLLFQLSQISRAGTQDVDFVKVVNRDGREQTIKP
jgi:hypothetical protein